MKSGCSLLQYRTSVLRSTHQFIALPQRLSYQRWYCSSCSYQTSTRARRFDDIPWPDASGRTSVSGIAKTDSRKSARAKMFKALRRWHPDKASPPESIQGSAVLYQLVHTCSSQLPRERVVQILLSFTNVSTLLGPILFILPYTSLPTWYQRWYNPAGDEDLVEGRRG